jgi:outer membrane protein W
MKKVLVFGLFVLIALGAQPLSAQKRIGIDGSFVAPLGNMNDFLNAGWGMGIFFDVMFTPNVGGRIDAAFNQFGKGSLTAQSTSWEAEGVVFPVRVGVNYFFDDPEGPRPYAGFMIGVYNRSFKGNYESGFLPPDSVISGTDTKSFFGIAPQLGYLIEIEGENIFVDASISYDIWFDDEGFLGDNKSHSYLRFDLGLAWAFGKSSTESEN